MRQTKSSLSLFIAITLGIVLGIIGSVSVHAHDKSPAPGVWLNHSAQKSKLKKGETFFAGKFRYEVLSLKGSRGGVALVGTRTKRITKAVVEEQIKKSGYTLTVLSIGKNAFKGCKRLRSVTTNTVLKSIEKNAFYGCRKLKEIRIDTMGLKKAGKNAFKGIHKRAVITVPEEKYSRYGKLLKGKGQRASVKIRSLHTHHFSEWQTVTAPECTAPGEQSSVCACGNAQTRTIPALGHAYTGEFTVDAAATCEKEGMKSRHCNRCGVKTEQTKIEKLSHVCTAYSYNEDASCTKDGTETAVCEMCGVSNTRTKPGTALGHAYAEEFTIDIAATCEKEGMKSRHCSRCGAGTDQTKIEKRKHAYTVYSYNGNASCTKDGTETAVCEMCGVSNTRTKPGTALGHAYAEEFTIDIAATCEREGEKSRHCSRCEAKTEQTKISKLEHVYIHYRYNNDATCITDGTETAVCETCGREHTRTKENSALITSGHCFGRWEINASATCTAAGSRQRICSLCQRRETETIPALGHNFINYMYNHDETCAADGTETAVCSRCSATDTRIKPGTMSNIHAGEWQTVIPATCLEGGRRERSCTVCGKKETEEIPAPGHRFSAEFTVDVSPTCSREGVKSRHCSRCDAVADRQAVVKTGRHSLTVSNQEKVPTCMEEGWKAYSSCVYEGCEYTTKEILYALGHTWNAEKTACTICGRAALEDTDTWTVHYTVDSLKSEGFDDEGKYEKKFVSERGQTVTVQAPAAKLGYKFVQWSDGNTQMERTDTWENMDKTIEAVYDYDFLSMPVIAIDTQGMAVDSRDYYVGCEIDILNTREEYTFRDKTARIRGRGHSTWAFPGKKPYRLKFDKKINLFGSGEEKDWILLANYIDRSLIRNHITYSIASLFETQKYTTTSISVEVYINGVYQGVYTLNEQTETGTNRVEIDETAEGEGLGFLVEMDCRGDGEMEGVLDRDWFKLPSDTTQHYNIKTPDTDMITEDQVNYVKNYLDYAYQVLQAGEGGTYDYEEASQYFDMRSFAEGYIVDELVKSIDIDDGLSFYMYKDKNGKLCRGPLWDYDISIGNITLVYSERDSWNKLRAKGNAWYKRLLESGEFQKLVSDILVQKSDEIVRKIDETIEEARSQRASFERNFERWELLSGTHNNALGAIETWDNHLSYVREWLCERSMKFLLETYGEADAF